MQRLMTTVFGKNLYAHLSVRGSLLRNNNVHNIFLKNQCFCFGCSLSTVLQHPQPQLTYTWMQMPGTTRPSLVASKIILGNIKHIVIFNRTSELWSYMISTVHRCLAEPVLTYRLHKEFIKAASKNPYCLFLTEMQSVDYWRSCKQACQCF